MVWIDLLTCVVFEMAVYSLEKIEISRTVEQYSVFFSNTDIVIDPITFQFN